MRFLRQSLTGLFLISVTLGVLVYTGYTVQSAVQARMSREARAPQNRERIFAVNTIRAVPGEIAPVMTAFGEVASRRTLEIRAASSGAVVKLAEVFVEGGQVEAGQILVEIDPAEEQAASERALSDIQDSEAEIREAGRALELAGDELSAAQEQAALRVRAFQRQTDLKARGVGTEAAVETAELAASTARAAVLTRRQALANARARVDQSITGAARTTIAMSQAQRHLADTVIRAGFSGVLSNVAVVEGGLVSQNERLAQLVDLQALEVSFRVSTQAYARLLDARGGLRRADVRVTLDVFGVDMTARGVLSRDSAAVGEGQTGRLVFAQLEGARGFKPGDFVTVEIDEAPLVGVVRLPASAINADGKVLVLGVDGRLEEMAVALLRRQGDDVLVRGSAIAGRDIVAQRSPLLGAGIKAKSLRTEYNDVGDDVAGAEPDIAISDARRAKIRAFVEMNTRMPKEVKERIIKQLGEEKVPAAMVARIELRMGG